MRSDLDSLAEVVRERRAILFVGAGLSMTVGLPSWRKLIEHMGEELGLDPACFLNSDSSYQTLAEYYRLQKGSIGPLRSWMDRNWSVTEEKIRASRLHEIVVRLDFPIIYTTNYDANLETAFRVHDRPYVKIANTRDIAKAHNKATQIIKYHGDFEDDQSLVIAETDYLNRLSFSSPLDIKLWADALGRTLLFIGYSMSDLNIRLLLHKLAQIWRDSGYEKDRPSPFVFMPRRNDVQEAVLAQWGINVIAGEGENPAASLALFLEELLTRVQGEKARAAP
ncbi:SIR2 family NAD-dependent protein deacylase [Roseomonas xinghualingensis]|uniref:SIR2 family NAD-dependent protein deacylase n=1 Tax=Roseomonas xinghualingensis TaxID=2986475 RepID=UPI0021F0CDFA|nr:SIR2 family protein [Roseomonas sp. SXEYE001]MCV4206128.1 SIR2 family protein [Roseomonas sp. SXEYE001]